MRSIRIFTQWMKAVAFILGATVLYTPVAVIATPQHVEQNPEGEKKRPHIVFLISEDSSNYEAHITIPAFAERLKKDLNYRVTVLLGKGMHGAYTYPDLEALSGADLLVIFARRIAIPHHQMNAIKSYLERGKPLVGIRTANHAFTVNEKIDEGFEAWPAFVADILGCENRGYGPTAPGTQVVVVADKDHSIVSNISTREWHSKGNVYLVAPLLDTTATVLLTGQSDSRIEPIAWTRKAGKSRVFYTSLGYPTDFDTPQFISLLRNGINWALNKKNK